MDLNIQWQMFDGLYEPSENYEIFNRTGPNFWNYLQSYLLDTIFASISRFFDPAKTMGQENLSLLAIIAFDEVQAIRGDLENREKTMRPIFEKGIKIWRHKRLSHADLNVALQVNALPEVPFADIKKLVCDISEFAREINCQIHGYDQSYWVGIVEWVPQVMNYLKLGIEQKDKRTGA